MATLILSAAGAAVGGPIGSAIGTYVGQQVDRTFARGPQSRLTDWRAPSSRYGDPIPAVLRRMRVAGVVLWTAPPVAISTVSKNGTGQGLSVSFAYGLSSGRVDEVVRIWADGRLILDEEGRQDVAFELRLHYGDEDQGSDPLIASIIGEELAPAYRGIAYLLFENFDLSSFGNRLPLITVELGGNGDPLLRERVCQGALGLSGAVDDTTNELEGFALQGDTKADAIASLCDAFNPAFAYDGSQWSLRTAPAHHIIDDHFWNAEEVVEAAFRMQSSSGSPSKISVRFFDPAIDFAAGEKSARLPGVERLRRIELPAALSGDRAKATAATLLARSLNERQERWLRLPLSYLHVRIGDEVSGVSPNAERLVVCESV